MSRRYVPISYFCFRRLDPFVVRLISKIHILSYPQYQFLGCRVEDLGRNLLVTEVDPDLARGRPDKGQGLRNVLGQYETRPPGLLGRWTWQGFHPGLLLDLDLDLGVLMDLEVTRVVQGDDVYDLDLVLAGAGNRVGRGFAGVFQPL